MSVKTKQITGKLAGLTAVETEKVKHCSDNSFEMFCLGEKMSLVKGHGEHSKRETKTSLTTTKIQGGCTTIYNLPSLFCDSSREGGGRREREKEGDTQGEM